LLLFCGAERSAAPLKNCGPLVLLGLGARLGRAEVLPLPVFASFRE
jgi:hypothetical protein